MREICEIVNDPNLIGCGTTMSLVEIVFRCLTVGKDPKPVF